VPFSVISSTISSSAYQVSAANRVLFIDGIRRAFLILGSLDFVGILPSVMRGDWRTAAKRPEPGGPHENLPED